MTTEDKITLMIDKITWEMEHAKETYIQMASGMAADTEAVDVEFYALKALEAGKQYKELKKQLRAYEWLNEKQAH